MSKEIRASIDEAFGFEAVCINSALVSAQNRQRLYWVGKRNADGTYSKVNVEQPEDRGILLKDVLDGVCAYREKGNCLCGNRCGTSLQHDIAESRHNYAAEPVCVASRGRYIGENGAVNQHIEARPDGKTNTLTRVEKDNRIAEPVGTTLDGKSFALTAYYSTGQNAPHTLERHLGSMVSQPVQVGIMPCNDGRITKSQANRIYLTDGKSVTLKAEGGGWGAKTGLYALPVDKPKCYATPCEWDENGEPTKAVSCSDGKVYPVYKVDNGQITIKDKQYPIKLNDGYYIIRKLTVSECKRLQTVPEWYDFSCVSNSQAYKMLGNGWTVEVIAHLIRSALCGTVEQQTTWSALL